MLKNTINKILLPLIGIILVSGFLLTSTEIGDNIGFNVSASYHNSFLYESTFADGIIPANWIFNASMSFDVPELQSVIKVGAVNLTGDDYASIPYTGLIGSQYYIKFTLNP